VREPLAQSQAAVPLRTPFLAGSEGLDTIAAAVAAANGDWKANVLLFIYTVYCIYKYTVYILCIVAATSPNMGQPLVKGIHREFHDSAISLKPK